MGLDNLIVKMATVVHGQLSEYQESEGWDSYSERLDFYFAANDIKDADKKKAVFLSACGANTYKLLRNLVTPNKPNDKTFDELIEVLRKHYSPKPNIIVCRFRFNTSVRNKGESVASYVARLQQLSEHCTFGTELNDMLRDRLVCGINHVPIQKRLFAESNLTFKKAFEIAQAMESAEKNAEDLQREGACAAASQGLPTSKPGQSNYMSNPKGVHKKSKQQTYTQKGGTNSNASSSKKSCYRCLGDHNPNDCKFKTVTCHKCKKYGHIAVACKSGGDSKGSHNKRKYNRAHHMSFHQGEEEQLGSNDNEYDYLFNVHSLNKPMEPPVWTEIKIDDKSLKLTNWKCVNFISSPL